MRTLFNGRPRWFLRTAAAATALIVAGTLGTTTAARADGGRPRAAAVSELPLTSTAVTPHADGRMVMFAVDTLDDVYIRTQLAAGSDTWSSWTRFTTMLSSFAARTNGNGLIEVFGVRRDGILLHSWQLAPNSDQWSGWEIFELGTRPSHEPSALSVTAALDGTLTLFALDGNGQVWGRTQYIGSNGNNGGGSWSPGGFLDGTMSTIVAQTNGNGLIELFGTNAGGQVLHRWERTHNTGNWAPWETFDAVSQFGASSITTTTMGPGGAVVVFYTLAVRGTIRHRYGYVAPNGSNGGGSWSPWGPLDGRMRGVTATTYPDRRMELFGVNSAGLLFQRKETEPGIGSWSPWGRVDGPTG